MEKEKQAIGYFEEAIREADVIIDECEEELEKELLIEQKGYFEIALVALQKQVPLKAKPLKKIPGICKCPVCRTDLCTENGKQIYCPDCGQALIV